MRELHSPLQCSCPVLKHWWGVVCPIGDRSGDGCARGYTWPGQFDGSCRKRCEGLCAEKSCSLVSPVSCHCLVVVLSVLPLGKSYPSVSSPFGSTIGTPFGNACFCHPWSVVCHRHLPVWPPSPQFVVSVQFRFSSLCSDIHNIRMCVMRSFVPPNHVDCFVWYHCSRTIHTVLP